MFVEPLVISLANSLLHSCPEVWQYFLPCIDLVGTYSSSAFLCKHGAPVGCLTSLTRFLVQQLLPRNLRA
uniref:Uncharacterized protein n=1 Tax=Zea mays TaxID=4577 RepID=B7ZYG6_MAIZE|nr:unknown [Zea mays]